MCRRARPSRALVALLVLAAGTGAAPTLEIAAPDAAEWDVCCRREQHFIKVGADASGEDLVVDVGKCRRYCRRPAGISKQEFRELQEAERDTDPIQLFLRHRERLASCVAPGRCEPLETALERHYTLRGPVTSAVTRRCGCRRRPAACRRRRRLLTFHPGTPHERTLDVGACGGRCDGTGDSCHPLRNKTVSIDGPNGAEIVSVVEECICTHGCYRMSVMEQVYDYSHSATEPSIKDVDVGRCVGTCTRDQRGRDCVWPPFRANASDPSECLMSLEFTSLGCVASVSEQHFYRTQEGRERALLSIQTCSCQ